MLSQQDQETIRGNMREKFSEVIHVVPEYADGH